MRVLDELGREIERIAHEAGDVRPRRRWWRRSGVLLGVVPLGIATVAVAATTSGILSGEPVKNPSDVKLHPNEGRGVVVDTGKLFTLRTPDPDGGLPWGLRLVKTSRGLGCVQIGRVNEDELGVVGQDGAFGDDGRFHARGPEVVEQTDCQVPDGAGTVFIAHVHSGLPASGDAASCDARKDCAPGSLRNLYYGLLGPEATAVTYVDARGKLARQPVEGPEGAYLIVEPTEPGRRNVGQFTVMATPGSGLRSVEYRDGSTCRIRDPGRIGGARPCPLKGFVEPKLEPVARAEVATDVRLRVGKGRAYPTGDKQYPQRRVTLSFRARRAADARSFYTFEARIERARGAYCGGITFGAIAKDVKAGAVVSQDLYFNHRCRGRVKVSVGYEQQLRPGQGPLMTGGAPNDKVGTATAALG